MHFQRTAPEVERSSYSGEHYRALFEAIADAVVVHEIQKDGPPGRFLEVNGVACERLGYTRDELLQMSPSDIDAPESGVDVKSIGHRVLAGETVTFEQTHVTRNGCRILVEIRAQKFNLEGRECVLSLIRDITERKQAREQLRRQKNLYAAISEINHTIIRLPEKQEIFQQVCRTAVERAEFLFAWIGEIDGDKSIRPAARYGNDEGYIDAIQPSLNAMLPFARGPLATAVWEGRFVLANDFMNDPSTVPWHGMAEKAGVRAFGAFPIYQSGQIVAVMSVYAAAPGFFDEEAIRLLNEMALDVSFGLDNIERVKREAAAKDALVRAEERYRQIAENIHEVFWLADPVKDEMLYVSPAYEAIWNRSCESAYQSRAAWLESIHPEDRERMRKAALFQYIDEDHVEEYRILRPDGTTRWIRDKVFPVRDKNGRLHRMAGVAVDITEQKLATEALCESERRFSDLLGTVEMVAIMLDQEGHITYCNDYLLDLTGWQREEVLGRDWFDLFVPHEAIEMKPVFTSLIANHPSAWHYQNEILTRSGERRLIEWNNTVLRSATGEVTGTASLGLDVTERNRVQRALAEQEEKFRALAEQSIAGIFMTDGEGVTYVNPRAADIFGYRPEELIGRPVCDVVSKRDWSKLSKDVSQRLAGGSCSAQFEFKGRRKDGAGVMIGAHGNTATIGGRRIIIGVLQDITDKLRAEETIRDYIARLERAILGTVDAVSSMVELRDPYTAGHERRVSELAAAIGVEMDLSEGEVKALRVTGLLHDIGKIALPAEILSKPGRLSSIEYEMVKEHSRLGYDILKSVDFPWPIAQTVLQHHERLDGSGYPQGLKGDDITLLARILAVADTVEAMSSHRPYRPGFGLEKALAEIEKGSGRLFDPQVVTACLTLFRNKEYAIPT